MTSTPKHESLVAIDRAQLWHPYTNTSPDNPLYLVERANGVMISLADGKELIDGMSSWWAVIHGYNHPELNQAVETQLKNMSHIMFGNFTHEPAIELGQLLHQFTKHDFSRVFFADSGSVSVEVAIKMALQFWLTQGKPHKQKLLSLTNGYHGDTFAAMSVTDPVNGMHSMFKGAISEQLFVDIPCYGAEIEWRDEYIAPFKQAIEQHSDKLAAVILEPLVQGAGGMKFYSAEYLKHIRALCDEHGVLLIFDEIATGFGRTGSLFAYQEAGVVPDILCLGKALTGGYMSLAATLASENVVQGIHQNLSCDAVIDSENAGLLMHGPTFMANPLACSVAIKSLQLLETGEWKQQVNAIENQLKQELTPLGSHESVKEVRVRGAIGVVEMVDSVDANTLIPKFIELGVWIRPFGKLIYIMPPYIIQPEQLTKLTQAIQTVITSD